MVTDWSTLGLVVQQGNSYVEVGRCGTPSIILVAPSLNFQDVPQGPSGMSRKQAPAVVFEVSSMAGAVTLEFQSKKQPHYPAEVDTVTPYQANPLIEPLPARH
jgi:hypothetical protein